MPAAWPEVNGGLISAGVLRRRGASLPFTVYRPSHVVGDSRTGEIDRLDGPYHVVTGLLRAPLDVSLPLPSRAEAPLHLVPIDYVVDAAYHVARHPDSRGATVHIVDRHPLFWAARRHGTWLMNTPPPSRLATQRAAAGAEPRRAGNAGAGGSPAGGAIVRPYRAISCRGIPLAVTCERR